MSTPRHRGRKRRREPEHENVRARASSRQPTHRPRRRQSTHAFEPLQFSGEVAKLASLYGVNAVNVEVLPYLSNPSQPKVFVSGIPDLDGGVGRAAPGAEGMGRYLPDGSCEEEHNTDDEGDGGDEDDDNDDDDDEDLGEFNVPVRRSLGAAPRARTWMSTVLGETVARDGQVGSHWADGGCAPGASRVDGGVEGSAVGDGGDGRRRGGIGGGGNYDCGGYRGVGGDGRGVGYDVGGGYGRHGDGSHGGLIGGGGDHGGIDGGKSCWDGGGLQARRMEALFVREAAEVESLPQPATGQPPRLVAPSIRAPLLLPVSPKRPPRPQHYDSGKFPKQREATATWPSVCEAPSVEALPLSALEQLPSHEGPSHWASASVAALPPSLPQRLPLPLPRLEHHEPVNFLQLDPAATRPRICATPFGAVVPQQAWECAEPTKSGRLASRAPLFSPAAPQPRPPPLPLRLDYSQQAPRSSVERRIN
jgi:hypothetical protein